jgi:hypothetical protein
VTWFTVGGADQVHQFLHEVGAGRQHARRAADDCLAAGHLRPALPGAGAGQAGEQHQHARVRGHQAAQRVVLEIHVVGREQQAVAPGVATQRGPWQATGETGADVAVVRRRIAHQDREARRAGAEVQTRIGLRELPQRARIGLGLVLAALRGERVHGLHQLQVGGPDGRHDGERRVRGQRVLRAVAAGAVAVRVVLEAHQREADVGQRQRLAHAVDERHQVVAQGHDFTAHAAGGVEHDGRRPTTGGAGGRHTLFVTVAHCPGTRSKLTEAGSISVGSHTSPTPSRSQSACSGLKVVGQLSCASGTPSPSWSLPSSSSQTSPMPSPSLSRWSGL